MSNSAELLQQLLRQLVRIWQAYHDSGPGQVDPALFENVELTAATLVGELSESGDTDDSARLVGAIETGVKLARRCVHNSEGLCFITGEAGLVPRQDLYEKFEAALATIRAAVEAGTD